MRPTRISKVRELVFGLTKLARCIKRDTSEGMKTGIYHSPARSYYFKNIQEINQLKAKILKSIRVSK